MGGIHLTSFIVLFDVQKIENVSSLVCVCVTHTRTHAHTHTHTVHVCVYHGVMKGVVWLQYYITCVYEYVCIVCIIMYMYVYLVSLLFILY